MKLKWIFKKIIPKGLFGRSLLILIIPVILLQSIVTYVFIERHSNMVTKLLSNDIASKMSSAVDVVKSTPAAFKNLSHVQDYIWRRFDLSFEMLLPESKDNTKYLFKKVLSLDDPFYQALTYHIADKFQVCIENENLLIKVHTSKGEIILKDQLKHLYPRTTFIFLWWILLAPLFLLFVSILFLKNQIKPLEKLSQIVDDFGKGRDVPYLKSAGSFEVRKVTEAFNLMKDRIQRQLTQRTEMLAGVSHDLRTPLTRMELQLELMSSSTDVQNLQDDVKEMSHMVEEFLAFAKGEDGEEMMRDNLCHLIKTTVKKFKSENIELYGCLDPLFLSYRRNAMIRCLSNIIENGMKYAKRLKISVTVENHHCILKFEDDGPGILPIYEEKVFRPFFRLETSRNNQTGGIGLGLAITRDIVLSHGGTIKLQTPSSLGGLCVTLSLPC